MPSSKSATRKHSKARRRLTPREVLDNHNIGMLVALQREDTTLELIQSDPYFFGSVFRALGLEFRPNAKKLVDIVKHDAVFEALGKVFEAAYMEPNFLIQLAKQIPKYDGVGRKLSREIIKHLIETGKITRVQRGGAFRFTARNIIFFIISLAVLISSFTSAQKAFHEGRVLTNPAGVVLSGLSDALGDVVEKLPAGGLAVRAVGALNKVLAGFGNKPSGIPEALLPMMEFREEPHGIKVDREAHRSLLGKRKQIGVKRAGVAVDIPKNARIPDLELLYGKMASEKDRLSDLMKDKNNKIGVMRRYLYAKMMARHMTHPYGLARYVLEPATQMAIAAASYWTNSDLELYNFTTEEIEQRIQTIEGEVAVLKSEHNKLSDNLTAHKQNPALIPQLPNIRDVGPALQAAIGDDIGALSLQMQGVLAMEDTDPSVIAVHAAIDAIVEKARGEGMDAPLLKWLELTLKIKMHDRLLENIQREQVLIENRLGAFQRELGWVDYDVFVGVMHRVAAERDYDITDSNLAFMENMFTAMRNYGLYIGEPEKAAQRLITQFTGGANKVEVAYISTVETHVDKLAASWLHRVAAASKEFLMCLVLAGMGLGLSMRLMGMKVNPDNAEAAQKLLDASLMLSQQQQALLQAQAQALLQDHAQAQPRVVYLVQDAAPGAAPRLEDRPPPPLRRAAEAQRLLALRGPPPPARGQAEAADAEDAEDAPEGMGLPPPEGGARGRRRQTQRRRRA